MSAIMVRLLLATLLIVPAVAADAPTFALWRAAELAQHETALSTKVGADHSARETLADYGHHRFRMLYRDRDGFPEQHDNLVDVVIVQGGEGTLALGGKMLDPKATSAGEWIGRVLEGAEQHPIGAGDVIHIPAGIPHSFLVPEGKHISSVLVKFPAK